MILTGGEMTVKKLGTPSRNEVARERGVGKIHQLLERGIARAGGIQPHHRIGYESPAMKAKRRNRKSRSYRR